MSIKFPYTINGLNNIDADDVSCDTFLNQPSSYFTGISSNIQTQLNTISSSGITLAQVQANANTFTDLNTFNKFFLKPTITNASTINWAFTDNNFMMLSYTGGAITFNLPNPTTADIGKQLHIILYYTTVDITFVAPVGRNINDDVNSDVSSKTYNSNVRFFSLTAINTNFAVWKMSAFQGLTRNYADTSYGQLASANNWASTNTFNTSIPTTTLTPTLGTELITKNYGDATYGRLANTNTFTLQNTFQNGILPCSGTRTSDIQLGGNNQLQYRQATSANNISIGDQTLQGDSDALGRVYNTGSRNIGIGHQVLTRLDAGSDMIFIGHQAGQNCGSTRLHSVQPSRCIAIGTNSQKGNLYATDAISIGYNSLVNASGPAVGNICIGSNTGNGLNFQNQNIIIGNNCGPTVNDNGVLAIGANCMALATGSFNSGTSVGASSGYNNAGGQGGCFIGALAGYANTTGNYNTCLGLRAGYSSTATINNTICLGYNSSALSNFECVFGGSTSSDQVFLTLPQKCKLYCNQLIGAVATYNISWRSNENVIINSATTTQINLPQATDATTIHIGATFNIIRTSGATSNCIISAFGTETIFYSGSSSTTIAIDSWVNSISFCCVNNVAGSPMWAVCIYNDRVTLATDSRRLQTLTDSSNVNYPVCFTTIATTGYNNVYANSSLTYNPSTSLLTVPNLSVVNNTSFVDLTNNQTIAGVKTFSSPPVMSGASITANTIPSTAINNSSFVDLTNNQTIAGVKTFSSPPVMSGASITANTIPSTAINNSTFVDIGSSQTITGIKTFPSGTILNSIYKPFATAFIGSNDTALPGLPTLYGFYFWTDSNPSGVPDTVITLPQLTTDMDGCKLTFRRMAYQGSPFVPRQLVIKTPTALFGGLNQLITARDSATTIGSGTNYVLLTTAVSRLGAFASLVVRQNAWYVID